MVYPILTCRNGKTKENGRGLYGNEAFGRTSCLDGTVYMASCSPLRNLSHVRMIFVHQDPN